MDVFDISNRGLTSFENIEFPLEVQIIDFSNNQITSFEHLPSNVGTVYCSNNLITSFEHLPSSVKDVRCYNNLITSFEHLPSSVEEIYCSYNPCYLEYREKGLKKIHEENYIRKFKKGIFKLQKLRLHYLLFRLWHRFWYTDIDENGYSRFIRKVAPCTYKEFMNEIK